jgi:hypothetical protein
MATISSIYEQKTTITRVIRTTRRERQEEVPLVSFDGFPPVERDLIYSRKIGIVKKKLQMSDRPALKTGGANVKTYIKLGLNGLSRWENTTKAEPPESLEAPMQFLCGLNQ